MRLDKFLCKMNLGTRSRTKAFIRQGLVKVNGFLIKSPDFQVDEEKDQVTFQAEILRYQKFQTHKALVKKLDIGLLLCFAPVCCRHIAPKHLQRISQASSYLEDRTHRLCR